MLRPSHIRMMAGKRSKWNCDPACVFAPGVAGTPAAGRNDLSVLPDCSGTGDWRSDADGGELACYRRGCNSAVRGHNANRDKTPRGIRCPGKPVAGEPLRHAPPCVLASGARQRQWLRGTVEPALVSDLTKVAIPEPCRSNVRVPSFLPPAFEVQDTTSAAFADDRTDDGAFGADDVARFGSCSENYVFR